MVLYFSFSLLRDSGKSAGEMLLLLQLGPRIDSEFLHHVPDYDYSLARTLTMRLR